jgi:hypothetical protein
MFAYLSYPDVPAALDWFTALGFEIVTRQDGTGGTVVHSEVWARARSCWATTSAAAVTSAMIRRTC